MVGRPIKTLSCLAGLAMCLSLSPRSGAWENPKVKPPPAKPQRQSGGESMAPLPLPATPVRRSEKKRQPSPPALIGMINFDAEARIVEGRRTIVQVMPTTTIDIERLMRYANNRLGIRYRYVPMTLSTFSWDPKELPLLYITGWTPMPRLGEQLREKLRRYLYDGGTLVVHAQCGRKEFVDTARREIQRILPGRELAPIDTDSPLFHAYFNISQMRVRKDDEPFRSLPPYLEAIYLGCRPAIVFSPIDLNCGWDIVNNPIMGGILYHQNDATALGVNVITAVLANMEYARAWGSERVFHEQEHSTRGQLVIAQVVHDGDWDPTPSALPSLMKYMRQNTTLDVQFKRETVDLAKVDAFKHPVLYITGLRDFTFTNAEVDRLRNYIESGGVLVADAAAGRKAFDEAFRREIKKVLPKAELTTLPLSSPIYQMPYKIRQVEYAELLRQQEPGLNAPTLQGITVDGQLAVIYSPFSLSNGWERLGFAYNRGYADDDAVRLGVNIFAYALTH